MINVLLTIFFIGIWFDYLLARNPAKVMDPPVDSGNLVSFSNYVFINITWYLL